MDCSNSVLGSFLYIIHNLINVICYFSSKSSSAIDLYRASDGKYIGTYMVNNSHEIESLAYDYSKGEFAILVNGGVDSIYTTNKLVIP